MTSESVINQLAG